VTSVRSYPTHTALHLDECKTTFWMKYNNQIVYNLPFLDVFPGYHQIPIAAQEDMYQTLLLFPIGCAQTQILAGHELSQTRCSKRPFRKFAYPQDSRNMHRRRGTGIHKSILSLKLLPLLIHRKISHKLRERE
jgi:hypothetical protein